MQLAKHLDNSMRPHGEKFLPLYYIHLSKHENKKRVSCFFFMLARGVCNTDLCQSSTKVYPREIPSLFLIAYGAPFATNSPHNCDKTTIELR